LRSTAQLSRQKLRLPSARWIAISEFSSPRCQPLRAAAAAAAALAAADSNVMLRVEGFPERRGPSDELPAGWEAKIDPATGRLFFHHASSSTSQWLSPNAPAPTRAHRAPPPEPYPQAESDGPDLLVLRHASVPDDSKPALADHHFVPQTTNLQAPRMGNLGRETPSAQFKTLSLMSRGV